MIGSVETAVRAALTKEAVVRSVGCFSLSTPDPRVLRPLVVLARMVDAANVGILRDALLKALEMQIASISEPLFAAYYDAMAVPV